MARTVWLGGVVLTLMFGASAGWAAEGAELEAKFTFEVGSSALDASMRARLNELAAAIKDAPPSWKVVIEGHTDSKGTDDVNRDVAKARAERIAAALVMRGIPFERLVLQVIGSSQPSARNDTSEGRAQNGRAVVRLRHPNSAPISERKIDSKPEATVKAEAEMPAPLDAPDEKALVSAEIVAEAPPSRGASLVPAPRAEPMAAMLDLDRSDSTPRGARFWWATGTSAAAVVGATGAALFAMDAATAVQRLDAAQTQLARSDLHPETRTAFESHAASLERAVGSDRTAVVALGTAAAAAATTAVVLWIQELSN